MKRSDPKNHGNQAAGGGAQDDYRRAGRPEIIHHRTEDVLYVRAGREPDRFGPVSVSPDGRISLQLINEIQAAGQNA